MGRMIRAALALLRDEEGIGTIEFAILAPFLLFFLFAIAELSLGINAYRKFQAVDAQIAGLVAMHSAITAEEVDDYFEIADTVMLPFSIGDMRIAVASISNENMNEKKIVWQRSNDGNQVIPDGEIPAPWGMEKNGFVMVMSSYSYVPLAGIFFPNGVEMKAESVVRLRHTNTLECWNC